MMGIPRDPRASHGIQEHPMGSKSIPRDRPGLGARGAEAPPLVSPFHLKTLSQRAAAGAWRMFLLIKPQHGLPAAIPNCFLLESS